MEILTLRAAAAKGKFHARPSLSLWTYKGTQAARLCLGLSVANRITELRELQESHSRSCCLGFCTWSSSNADHILSFLPRVDVVHGCVEKEGADGAAFAFRGVVDQLRFFFTTAQKQRGSAGVVHANLLLSERFRNALARPTIFRLCWRSSKLFSTNFEESTLIRLRATSDRSRDFCCSLRTSLPSSRECWMRSEGEGLRLRDMATSFQSGWDHARLSERRRVLTSVSRFARLREAHRGLRAILAQNSRFASGIFCRREQASLKWRPYAPLQARKTTAPSAPASGRAPSAGTPSIGLVKYGPGRHAGTLASHQQRHETPARLSRAASPWHQVVRGSNRHGAWI